MLSIFFPIIKLFKIAKFKFALKLLLTRNTSHILCRKYLPVVLRQRVFYDSVAFIRTQHYADRRVIALVHQFSGIVVDVHLHLSQILMSKIAYLQINQYKAFEDIVVKYKVDIKIASVKADFLLTGLKTKAASKLQ